MGFYPTYGKVAQHVTFNAKGEVVTADHSTKPTFNRSYEFDGIGNRKKSADSLTLPVTDNYTANALNQYGSIDGNTRSFDADGNLVDDGVKQYEWDGMNRLTLVRNKSTGDIIAQYRYDFASRRISKEVGSIVTIYVYDGWNLIAEYSPDTLLKTYTWGSDESGRMQDYGGVGGLLSVSEGSNTYYPVYDGNGNVSEYVDATGIVVAHYEYDAFGQVVGSGSKKDDFTHQFSTKQLDSESGLYYYGYRYYDVYNAVWLNRDPSQEQGGLNLYGFVSNDSVNHIDVLGLFQSEEDFWRHMFPDWIERLFDHGEVPPEWVKYKPTLPNLSLDFSGTNGFTVSGSAPTAIPGVNVQLTGTVGVKYGDCCKADGTKGEMVEFSGEIGAGPGFGTGGWQVTKNIAGVAVDFGDKTPCPENPETKVQGKITISAAVGSIGSAGCEYTFPGGGFACSGAIEATAGSGGANASVVGSITIAVTKTR